MLYEVITRTGEAARALAAEGWDLPALGSDVLALRNGLERELAVAKGEVR